jgi:hypothetical protein
MKIPGRCLKDLSKKPGKFSKPSFRRKPGEAGFSRTYLTYVRAAERVQRVWLHPGQRQHITDFNHFNILDPGFRRGDNVFFNNLLIPHDPVVQPIG